MDISKTATTAEATAVAIPTNADPIEELKNLEKTIKSKLGTMELALTQLDMGLRHARPDENVKEMETEVVKLQSTLVRLQSSIKQLNPKTKSRIEIDKIVSTSCHLFKLEFEDNTDPVSFFQKFENHVRTHFSSDPDCSLIMVSFLKALMAKRTSESARWFEDSVGGVKDITLKQLKDLFLVQFLSPYWEGRMKSRIHSISFGKETGIEFSNRLTSTAYACDLNLKAADASYKLLKREIYANLPPSVKRHVGDDDSKYACIAD